ncbi:hypothetical protein ACWDG1_34185 [Streptomyces sp. NPDC001177]
MKGMAAATVPAVSAVPRSAASGCPSRTISSACAGPTSGKGQTLYLPEEHAKSTAPTGGGACAFAWPPPLPSGTPKAARFARSNLISTSKRSDGITPVTYTGHPLHCFAGDMTAGDTDGEETSAFDAAVVRRNRIRQQGRTRLMVDS